VKTNITDAEIRALLEEPGTPVRVRIICKLALNDAATYKRAGIVDDARERVARILEQRRSAS
jgi:hypothetical protein